MAVKTAIMKLEVDLQCEKCYMKVKKILCKFPQIRDQFYDKKSNTVTIKVVCCSPETVRDRLCCQGGGSIKGIEIVEPPQPEPPEPEKRNEDKNPAPSAEPPKQDAAPSSPQAQPAVTFPVPSPVSVLALPLPAALVGLFYKSDPRGPPGFYGRPIYDSYGGSGPCYVGHTHQPLFEEDASVCTIN